MIALVEYQINVSYRLASVNLARKALAVLHGGVSDGMAADLRSLTARYADPGTPTVSARSDSALKYKTAFPDGDPVLAMEMYGLSDEQIRRNKEFLRRTSSAATLDQLEGNTGASAVSESENAKAFRDKFEALGIAVRAGVEPEDAAKRVGLSGIKFTGAVPAMLRMPETEARKLED